MKANKQSQLVVLHDDVVVARHDCFQIHSAKSVALEVECAERRRKAEEALNGTALLLFKGDKEGVPSLPPLLQSSLNWSAKGRPAHEFLFPANAARSRISIGVPSFPQLRLVRNATFFAARNRSLVPFTYDVHVSILPMTNAQAPMRHLSQSVSCFWDTPVTFISDVIRTWSR